MDILQTIALLCQINGAGANSASLMRHTERKQLECQQYYVKCLSSYVVSYGDLSKCVKERKLDN